ncbi:PREDICTED: calcium-dependent secretion activator 2-like [Poecilia mexicana]|uniref:calcium-dependent secretion activator 2-like n=1 Tax=Poecilia mexicana TaxID=48701 RepID=UPI00072DEDC8|nr:PREDICTED: calcium-dependent secretion activator 2-like [Poecilia mexicana]
MREQIAPSDAICSFAITLPAGAASTFFLPQKDQSDLSSLRHSSLPGRHPGHLCSGPFHKHLQDLFIPLVVRYIDLMETSIAQSIHRGFEQETWHSVRLLTNNLASVPLPRISSLPLTLPQMPSFSVPAWFGPIYENTLQGVNLPDIFNGSATSEDLFWKLDALQMFVMDLHWPEPEFAKHLEQRLKLMASDMMEACVKRTKSAFEAKMAKTSRSTEFRVPLSVCTMFNVLLDAKKQSSKLCVLDCNQEIDIQWQQYHSKIDVLIDDTFKEMIFSLTSKCTAVLESVLSKLSRYDEGTFFSSILSFTKPRDSYGINNAIQFGSRVCKQLQKQQFYSGPAGGGGVPVLFPLFAIYHGGSQLQVSFTVRHTERELAGHPVAENFLSAFLAAAEKQNQTSV